jgi:hypothetical protein
MSDNLFPLHRTLDNIITNILRVREHSIPPHSHAATDTVRRFS